VRKIVVGELLSLDGVAEDPNRFFTEWDDVVDASIPRLIATQDAVILGRRSYDEWVGFWPGSEIEPFATFINGVAKHVATSAPPQWTNAHVIDGDVDAEGADVVSEQVPGHGVPDGQVVVEKPELDLALGDCAVPVLVLHERGVAGRGASASGWLGQPRCGRRAFGSRSARGRSRPHPGRSDPLRSDR
jgi:hypothetical protein